MSNKSVVKKNKIPSFKSYAEEAKFWDRHSTTDFENEFRPVKVKLAKNLSQAITVRFDPEALAKLSFQARDRGIGPTTLARMWVLERLKQEVVKVRSR